MDDVYRTMVTEVEAAVNPNAVLVDLDVFLRVRRPLAVDGDPFALQHAVRRGGGA
jgi:hypothetical protein